MSINHGCRSRRVVFGSPWSHCISYQKDKNLQLYSILQLVKSRLLREPVMIHLRKSLFVSFLLRCFGEQAELFSISLVSSPFNNEISFKMCPNERISDAAANFLLSQGIHADNFEPSVVEYANLLDRMCVFAHQDKNRWSWVLEQCSTLKGNLSYAMPNLFCNEDNKYVTLYFQKKSVMDAGVTSARVYLREGYSPEQLSNCACLKHSCSSEEYMAVVDYLSSTLASIS